MCGYNDQRKSVCFVRLKLMAFMKSFESCSRLVSASLLPQLSQLTYSFLLGNCEVIGTIPKKKAPFTPNISSIVYTKWR